MTEPEMVSAVGAIYSSTAVAVGMILAAAGLGSAFGWALIAMKFMEGVARQPEMLPTLRVQFFITGGLMESFPFIVLAFAMWFVFANPFVDAAVDLVGG